MTYQQHIVAILFGVTWSLLAQAEEMSPIDYEKLGFSVALKTLRAGNHDEKGQNDYYLRAVLLGLPALKEEAKKPLAERKKSESKLGEFAELKIPNLKYWQADKKPNLQFIQQVSGQKIRELVGETMRTYKINEEFVAILYKIEMYERNKLGGLIGQDTLVGESKFFIIPESIPRTAKMEEQTLQISDTLGLRVELLVSFVSIQAKK